MKDHHREKFCDDPFLYTYSLCSKHDPVKNICGDIHHNEQAFVTICQFVYTEKWSPITHCVIRKDFPTSFAIV